MPNARPEFVEDAGVLPFLPIYRDHTDFGANKRRLFSLPEKNWASEDARFKNSGGDLASKKNLDPFRSQNTLAGKSQNPLMEYEFEKKKGLRMLKGYVNAPIVDVRQLGTLNDSMNPLTRASGGAYRNLLPRYGQVVPLSLGAKNITPIGYQPAVDQWILFPGNAASSVNDPLSIAYAVHAFKPDELGTKNNPMYIQGDKTDISITLTDNRTGKKTKVARNMRGGTVEEVAPDNFDGPIKLPNVNVQSSSGLANGDRNLFSKAFGMSNPNSAYAKKLQTAGLVPPTPSVAPATPAANATFHGNTGPFSFRPTPGTTDTTTDTFQGRSAATNTAAPASSTPTNHTNPTLAEATHGRSRTVSSASTVQMDDAEDVWMEQVRTMAGAAEAIPGLRANPAPVQSEFRYDENINNGSGDFVFGRSNNYRFTESTDYTSPVGRRSRRGKTKAYDESSDFVLDVDRMNEYAGYHKSREEQARKNHWPFNSATEAAQYGRAFNALPGDEEIRRRQFAQRNGGGNDDPAGPFSGGERGREFMKQQSLDEFVMKRKRRETLADLDRIYDSNPMAEGPQRATFMADTFAGPMEEEGEAYEGDPEGNEGMPVDEGDVLVNADNGAVYGDSEEGIEYDSYGGGETGPESRRERERQRYAYEQRNAARAAELLRRGRPGGRVQNEVERIERQNYFAREGQTHTRSGRSYGRNGNNTPERLRPGHGSG